MQKLGNLGFQICGCTRKGLKVIPWYWQVAYTTKFIHINRVSSPHFIKSFRQIYIFDMISFLKFSILVA